MTFAAASIWGGRCYRIEQGQRRLQGTEQRLSEQLAQAQFAALDDKYVDLPGMGAPA